MHHLIDSVQKSLTTGNWYAALSLSLTLPDIAGKVDSPNAPSGRRYADWFDTYVGGEYKTINSHAELMRLAGGDFDKIHGIWNQYRQEGRMGELNKEQIFLSGNDCYALRCAFLHEGNSDISAQRAKDILDDFAFVAPSKSGNVIHCNQSGNKLQLQVDIFSKDISDGVVKWLAAISGDAQKQARLNSMLMIQDIDASGTLII
ncbi:hypothetical protein A6C57_00120 [Fibrella sp. ES10-3-2-2]|nr:hypothetical protein A6C57_00120 [Fibrella sp. ES10-3-2-2]